MVNFAFLINMHVGNDKSTAYSFVQSLYKLCFHHREVLSKRRTGNFYEKCLVLDEFLARISCDGRPHDGIPCINETFLVERRFESALSQHLLQHIGQRHGSPLLRIYRHWLPRITCKHGDYSAIYGQDDRDWYR